MDIVYSKKSVKVINALDNTTRKRIMQAINNLPDGDVKRIVGQIDTWRLRVGGWRVLFSFADESTILIEKIAPRGQIYKEGL